MTLSDLKQAFYDYVDDRDQDEFEEPQATRFINRALEKIARKVDAIDEGYFEKCATFTVSGDQVDEVFDLPNDFKRVKYAERLDGTNQPVEVDWVQFKDRYRIPRWPPNRLRDKISPQCYLKGRQLGVVEPTESYTLRLWYSYSPAELEQDTDEPLEIPRDHHNTIALQAAKIAISGVDGKPFNLQDELDDGIRDLEQTLHSRNRHQTRHVRVIED